eukprot:g49707.t1
MSYDEDNWDCKKCQGGCPTTWRGRVPSLPKRTCETCRAGCLSPDEFCPPIPSQYKDCRPSPPTFTCSDGCQIPASWENDDWCDCSDCSDEKEWKCETCHQGCPPSQLCPAGSRYCPPPTQGSTTVNAKGTNKEESGEGYPPAKGTNKEGSGEGRRPGGPEWP